MKNVKGSILAITSSDFIKIAQTREKKPICPACGSYGATKPISGKKEDIGYCWKHFPSGWRPEDITINNPVIRGKMNNDQFRDIMDSFNQEFNFIFGDKFYGKTGETLYNFLFRALTQVRERTLNEMQKICATDHRPPMGVSEWREYGERYGYWGYFEKEVRERTIIDCKAIVLDHSDELQDGSMIVRWPAVEALQDMLTSNQK